MPSSSPLDRLRAAAEALEFAPAHVAALLVLASLACAGLVGLWWLARPAPDEAVAPVLATAAPTATPGAVADAAAAGTGAAAPMGAGGGAGTTPPPPGEVVVHVSGAVASEGVLTLPGGARVVDAVEAAGGVRPTARTEQLNLARTVMDGEQVHVPTAREVRTGGVPGGAGSAGASVGGAPGTPGQGATAGAGGTAADGATVSLNRATATELEALPGVGPVLAQRMIEHREDIGGFTSVEQLLEVVGIGDKTLAELRDHVTP